jgi:hypothetical protein
VANQGIGEDLTIWLDELIKTIAGRSPPWFGLLMLVDTIVYASPVAFCIAVLFGIDFAYRHLT